MASGTEPSKARTALRAAGVVLAVISAVVAVFLVVFSDASRSAQFGMLLGFWAALILAFSLVRGHEPAAQPIEPEPVSTEIAVVPAPAPTVADLVAGMAVELRRSAELEAQNAEVLRREFQLSLELMLRREVEHVMTAQLELLRQEIAGLRGEILDNVGGQLRLERIETTRLIGSDVQALQQEIRRLATLRESMELSIEVEEHRIIEARVEPEPVPAVVAEPAAVPVPEAEPEEVAEPEPASSRSVFSFADLPSVSRLTPLPAAPEASRYSGRRRAAGEQPDDEVPAARSGGQRRARDDSDDVLARLLGR